MDSPRMQKDLQDLFDCLQDNRLGLAFFYASFAIYVFDYVMTLAHEIETMWWRRRISINTVAFFVARYVAFLCVLTVIIWPQATPLSESVAVVLRAITIAASEAILALRTWAMWGAGKKMGWGLVGLAAVCSVPPVTVVAIDAGVLAYKHISPGLAHIAECHVVSSGKFVRAYIFPYIAALVYEFATFSLCLIKVISLRRTTGGIRLPLAEILWRDGMIYYLSTLFLSSTSIILVMRPQTAPSIRSGAANMQAALHSMIATRVLMHLASMDRTVVDISVITRPRPGMPTQQLRWQVAENSQANRSNDIELSIVNSRVLRME